MYIHLIHLSTYLMKFHSNTHFFDYEGMPVSSSPYDLTNEFDLKFSDDRLRKYFLCWDELPPRSIRGESTLRNGAACDEDTFRRLVHKCILSNKSDDAKQLLLYEYWFKENESDSKWLDWLNGLSNNEVILLVLSLNIDLAKQREMLDAIGMERLDTQLLIHFHSSLVLANSFNLPFLFFIQDLSVRTYSCLG